LLLQSALSRAVTTVTRVYSVAAGVFAPGHLGELTQIVPFELVDAVLAETSTVQSRLRLLPSRVGVYYLLAMCLFPEVGYRRVWSKLISGLDGIAVYLPGGKALRDLRRRIGVAPVKALFEVLAGPLARPATRGVCFGRYRTVSFDGCTSQKTPDTARNRAWLGKSGRNGYPMLELMTLVETGTRALLGAVFGPTAEGETSYATKLLHLLDKSMLVLWDKGFDGNVFIAAVADTGAQFLGRLRANRRLPVLAHLADGSYLSIINGIRVRVVEALITVTCADGSTYSGSYRLVTSLLDHRRYPATALISLYHERWEHESAYYALRETILNGRILRSGDPVGVEQEMWALLTLYQVLRTVMVDASESQPDIDPDRASFTIAMQTAREQVTNAAGVLTEGVNLVGAIGRAVLAELLPARRTRVSSRRVKSPLSRYAKQTDGKPTTSQKITKLDIAVLQAGQPAAHSQPTPGAAGREEPVDTPGEDEPHTTGHSQSPIGVELHRGRRRNALRRRENSQRVTHKNAPTRPRTSREPATHGILTAALAP
jgi:hypothetical protein